MLRMLNLPSGTKALLVLGTSTDIVAVSHSSMTILCIEVGIVEYIE